jgi:hypothetical protein
MSSIRVEIQEGSEPIILIAPHCEEQLSSLTKKIAHLIDASFVINHGWERCSYVDYLADKANCNNIDHLMEDVVKEEFLDPIIDYALNYRHKNFINIYVMILHGMDALDSDPDIVLGTGGNRPSCDIWRRDVFAEALMNKGFDVAEGKQKGKYAGWSKKNLNQLFKQDTNIWHNDKQIHSFQLEIKKAWRIGDGVNVAADAMSKSIFELMDHGDIECNLGLSLEQF